MAGDDFPAVKVEKKESEEAESRMSEIRALVHIFLF